MCHRITPFLITLAWTATTYAASSVNLTLVGQPSLWSSNDILLVFDQPVDTTSASDPGNYTIAPNLVISEVTPNPFASNLVLIQTAPATPLVAGMEYTVQMTGGNDAHGLPIDPLLTQATFTARTIAEEAENILACQLPEGPFAVANRDRVWNAGDPIWIVPYFSCFAAQGLLQAYRVEPDSRYTEAVRNYLLWHASEIRDDNLITDYTGIYPTFSSTGTFDSTDSYGALFLMLLWQYSQVAGDLELPHILYTAVEKSVAAMELTLQSDGLTWAQPDYKIKYTMDNSEVFQGFYAAAQLARLEGRRDQYEEWFAQANRVRNAVRDKLYYGDTTGRYSIGMDASGGLHGDGEDYYPDAMANLMAIVFTHTPADPRTNIVWNRVKEQFSANYIPHPSTEWLYCAVASHVSDATSYAAGHARMMERHNNIEQTYYASHDSGNTLTVNYIERPYAGHIPAVTPGFIVVDGALDESAWQSATHFRLHRWGLMTGFDNADTYDYPGNTIDPDAIYTLSLLCDGITLYVGLDAPDRYITSAATAEDSDGLAFLTIQDPSNETTVYKIGYTFFPNTGTTTVATPIPGCALEALSPGSAAFQFKTVGNTPNDPANTDTGYQMEFRLELSSPALGGFSSDAREIELGVRLADMDGTPGQGWPWSGGAYGTMMQLYSGLHPEDYTCGLLRLSDPIESSEIVNWSIY